MTVGASQKNDRIRARFTGSYSMLCVLWPCFKLKLHAYGSWTALWETRAITAMLNSVL